MFFLLADIDIRRRTNNVRGLQDSLREHDTLVRWGGEEFLAVLPAALFYAVVITGAEGMSRATGVPVFLADVIQGVSLICMLSALLFTRYRLVAVRSGHA